MKILALDSCTLTGSAAIVVDGEVLAESTARVRSTHSEQLLPLVDEVLTRAGVALDTLDRIAVGVGPGSFTGVRLGVSTAKGLHVATGVPLVGVTSLDALAASAWAHRGRLLAALDGRRDEVFAALYDCDETRALVGALHGAPEVVGAAALQGHDDVITVVGDLSSALFLRLASAASERFVRAPAVLATPLARFIAWEVIAGRGRLDDGSLEPEYMRGSDAKLPGGREVAR